MPDNNRREELRDWLHGRRGPMLEAIYFYQESEVPATPAKVRYDSGVPSGSFESHLEKLMDPPERFELEPLVEISERKKLNYSNPTRIFRLTEAGVDLVESELIDNRSFKQSDYDALSDRVDKLEGETSELRTQLGLVRDTNQGVSKTRVDELEKEVDELRDVVKQLVEEI